MSSSLPYHGRSCVHCRLCADCPAMSPEGLELLMQRPALLMVLRDAHDIVVHEGRGRLHVVGRCGSLGCDVGGVDHRLLRSDVAHPSPVLARELVLVLALFLVLVLVLVPVLVLVLYLYLYVVSYWGLVGGMGAYFPPPSPPKLAPAMSSSIASGAAGSSSVSALLRRCPASGVSMLRVLLACPCPWLSEAT